MKCDWIEIIWSQKSLSAIDYECSKIYKNKSAETDYCFKHNSTNTCVERCPNNSYGDAHTLNRFCVAVCTGESFADDSTTLCVDICPASPPTFGYKGNWTCLMKCPDGFWADSITRTCK